MSEVDFSLADLHRMLNGSYTANNSSHMEDLNCSQLQFLCANLHADDWESMELCFLEECLGPQSVDSRLLYPITLVYVAIFIVGVGGNLATMLVILRNKQLQTVTDAYLLNLAIADLITLFSGLPFDLHLMWLQYPWVLPDSFCNLKAWLLETTSYASVLTIFFFSIERYIAICHSFRLIHNCANVKYILSAAWMIAGLCAIPFALYHQTDHVYSVWEPDLNYGPLKLSKMCMLALFFRPNLIDTFNWLFHTSAVLFFLIPLVVIIFLYARVVCTIQASRRFMRENNNDSIPPDFYSRRVLYILISVVGAFFLCYMPFQLQRLLFFYLSQQQLQYANTYMYHISGVLFYFSAIINPILYNVISARYRNAFKSILTCQTYAEGSERRYNTKSSRSFAASTPYELNKLTNDVSKTAAAGKFSSDSSANDALIIM